MAGKYSFEEAVRTQKHSVSQIVVSDKSIETGWREIKLVIPDLSNMLGLRFEVAKAKLGEENSKIETFHSFDNAVDCFFSED